MTLRKILLYCALTLVMSWSMQFYVLWRYGSAANPAAVPLAVLTMFTPALVALGFAVFDREARRRLCWKPSWRMLPLCILAVLVPILIAFVTLGWMMAAGWGGSEWFTFSRTGVAISAGPWLLGKGAQPWAHFIGNVLLTGGYFALFSAGAAMGEELGWRGFLQGLLVERLGITRGITLVGLIWALWHLPVLLAGYNYPEHPVLGAVVLFPLQLIGAAFFLGWLTLRTGSFWAAAIAHGAVNSIETGILSHIAMRTNHLYLDGSSVLLTVLVGFVCWLTLRGPESGHRANGDNHSDKQGAPAGGATIRKQQRTLLGPL